jgi:acetyl esterase/lipase
MLILVHKPRRTNPLKLLDKPLPTRASEIRRSRQIVSQATIIHPLHLLYFGFMVGALIFGSRVHVPQDQLNFYLKAGNSLVSIDYQLAPETKLPEIVRGVADALQWVHKYGKDSLNVDPNRIFLLGHSGGGYLALTAGYSGSVRPRAIVSFYGYGDILDDWYTQPSTFYLTRPLVSKEAVQKLIHDAIITSAPFKERFNIYLYTRQQGNWPLLVGGRDPKNESDWFRKYCPVENIDASYPPVLLIHGDKDTDVPYSESVKLRDKLESKGVKNKLITMKGQGHVFELSEGGLSNPFIGDVFNKVIVFLGQYK